MASLTVSTATKPTFAECSYLLQPGIPPSEFTQVQSADNVDNIVHKKARIVMQQEWLNKIRERKKLPNIWIYLNICNVKIQKNPWMNVWIYFRP